MKKIDRKYLIAIIALAVACLLLRYFYTYLSTIESGIVDKTLFSYTYFTAVVPAVAVFLTIKQISWQKWINSSRKAKILAKISGCSLGIYLIHVFVMNIELRLLHIEDTRLVWRTACIVMTYAVCLAIVLLAKKIPCIRKIFP